MITRGQVLSVLNINGISPSESKEKIRAVLLSARYSEAEVEEALLVLQNASVKKSDVSGLHKIFRTSQALQPNEISKLLNIDIAVEDEVQVKHKKTHALAIQVTVVILLSIALSIAGVLFYMKSHQIGLYHPSSGYLESQ